METCKDCGKQWGVIGAPRANIQCKECARPKPNYHADVYWHLRSITGWGYERYHSAEWWDQQTSLDDMRHAAVFAKTLTV